MLGIDRVCLALTLVTAAAVGCGGAESPAGTSGTGGGFATTSSASSSSSGAGGGTSAASSSSTGGLTCAPGDGTTLVVTKLAFGEGNAGQWKKVGLNIDGLSSTASSKDVCTPNDGGNAATAYPDGDNGIDNSFGKNLLPTLLSVDPTWVNDVNMGAQNGFFSVLLKMYCLPPTGDVPAFTTKLFGGATLGSKPKFDGTDKWPVVPELLTNLADPESSAISFPSSSVVGAKFDSGKGTFILTIPITVQGQTSSIKLTLYSARATMTLNDDRKGASAGTISGVLNTEEFVAEVKKIGVLLNLCDQQLFMNILTQVRQASDILDDGTQDPNKVCNGISIGLGFEMAEAQIGNVAPPTAMGASCP
ncbi:MAG: hypothetical protein ABJE95_09335 [Byssovorax sp.]